jgi:hypothetical protein
MEKFGSGMEKFGSGINIGSATLVLNIRLLKFEEKKLPPTVPVWYFLN